MIDPHVPPPVGERRRILPKMAIAVRGSEGGCELLRSTPGDPRNFRLWHTASNGCGAKVRTRSERSRYAESVRKRGDLTETSATKVAVMHNCRPLRMW